jgi:hypothetical protein
MGAVGSSRLRWCALTIACALMAGACGSTVSQQAQRRAAASQDANLDSGSASDATAGSSGTDTGSASGTGGVASTGRTNAATGTRGAGATGPVGSESTAIGPGVTDKEINVGLLYAVNSAAANAAIGASGIDQGDQHKNSQIVVDDINAHGGVLGRKLVPVYHELDATSTDTGSAQYQQACDDLTGDHKILVAFAGEEQTFLQCLHNRKVIAVSDNLSSFDEAVFHRFPYYFEISGLNLDRVASAEVAGLKAQNYFTGWNAAVGQPAPGKAKVGILTIDEPGFRHATDQVLVPALASLGYGPDPADVIRVAAPERQSDAGALAAAVSSAVLKFRSDNVTHVLILEAKGVITLLFGNNAESQRYYPRYGANSQTGQQALADSGAFPRSQLAGTLGIGWLPGLDITPAENTDDGPYSNDVRRRCVALYKANGVTFENTNAAAASMATCNSLWFFRDVMNKAAGPNREAFLAVVNRLGTSFEGIGTFGTRFDPNHHAGVSAVRYWAYLPSCSCMRYTSGNIDVP